jgi:hypothetical protein
VVGNSSGGKKIEDVQVGDRVKSFADDKIVNSSVSQIYKSQRDYYFEIIAGDYGVSVTAEHPFYIGSGKYEETQNLKVGDTLYVEEGGEMMPKQITSIKRVDEKTDVYNMTVDGTHTYFANGFGVHNKTSYVGPTCASGTTLSCASPAVNRCEQYIGACDALFPSRFYYSSADPATWCAGPTALEKNYCQTNCGCCAPGETFVCSGTDYDYIYNSYLTELNNKDEIVAVDPKSCETTADAYVSTEPYINIQPGDPTPWTVNTCKWEMVCIRNCNLGPLKVEEKRLIGCTFTSNCKRCEGCAPACDDTAPTGITASGITSTTATITWTPGANGVSQLIRVDEDLAEVENGCPTVGDCEAAATLTTTDTSEIGQSY